MDNLNELLIEGTSEIPNKLDFSTIFEDEVIVFRSNDWRKNRLLRFQILGGYLVFILFGLAEQTVGTLIPKFQVHYKINDIQTSFIFLASITGYFIMAFISAKSHSVLGVRGVLVMGISSMTCAFLIISMYPPYFILVLSYIFNGIGFGSIDASLGSWMGSLVDSNEILGVLHGCYGLGSMISPPLITYLIDKRENSWPWPWYYLFLASIGSFCILWISITYRQETPKKYKYESILKNEKNEELDEEIELSDRSTSAGTSASADTSTSRLTDDDNASMKELLRSPEVWFLAITLFVYVGNEVAFGQWVVSYLTRIKMMTYKSSSYLASSFWSGLTLGRIILGFATSRLFPNELSANFTYFAISFIGFFAFYIFTLTEWHWILFPVAFFTGVFVGPIFPTTIVCGIKILPSKFHTGGIGFICAFGGGGGATIPFIMGVIADSKLGLELFPVLIATIASISLVLWLILMKKYGTKYTSNKI